MHKQCDARKVEKFLSGSVKEKNFSATRASVCFENFKACEERKFQKKYARYTIQNKFCVVMVKQVR